MKKMSKVDKLLYILNIIVSVLLLFSYLLPYLSPASFPSLAVVSLGVPILIIVNIIFAIYWLIRLKKQFFIPFIVLILGFNSVTSLFLFSADHTARENSLSIMNYNVKGFHHLGWKNKTITSQKIFNFIWEKKPDIVALQEYYIKSGIDHKFPYEYVKTKATKSNFGYAILSKYEIINSGSLDFKKSHNNAIFVDLKIDTDTVRVYNIHLESLGVNLNKENFGEENSEKLYQRIKKTFSKQAIQTELFLAHKEKWKGRIIICGDLNNTAFSWVYNEISNDMVDTFLKAGKGFGKTYDYPFPLRIDFILSDEHYEVDRFKTYSVKYSDHFPIIADLHKK